MNQLKLTTSSGREDDEDDDDVAAAGDESDSDEDGERKKKKKKSKSKQKRRRKQSLPASLINTYFRLFEVAIKKSEVAREASGKGRGKEARGAKVAREEEEAVPKATTAPCEGGSSRLSLPASIARIPTCPVAMPPWRSTSTLCTGLPTPVPPRRARRL